ncbi:MAG: efflux RND transporter periplasmic adaptor subunit [Pseudomonadota bacterium]
MSGKRMYLIGVLFLVVIIAVVLFFSFRGCGHDHAASENNILYYTCGMHPSVRISPEEYEKGNVNCPICNMKLIPVYKETKEQGADKKILFYRNPMNPAITSSVPAKDEMGMDYVPVYEEPQSDDSYYGCGMEGEEHVFSIKGVPGMKCPICGMPLKKISKAEADKLRGVAGRVEIKGEEARLAGVRIEPVRRLNLFKEIRTVGRVAYDPELAVAEEEYVSSIKALDKIRHSGISEITARSQELVESAKRKLKLLGLGDDQIENLRKTHKIHTSLILPEEKMWIYGDIYEYEQSWLKPGETVKITTVALPGEEFEGTVSSINPVLDPKTRSLKFRAEVDNKELKLKPDMYVDIVVKSNYSDSDDGEVLAIPKDSVLDTGMRKIVWFDKGNGTYEGREIAIGPEAVSIIDGKANKYYPVLKGAREGEMVVTKANFLIDSQSQISGTAASAYGGALGSEGKPDSDKQDETTAPVHNH